jgi:NAD(P)-dependent dehydrogenase (short-subunit alcohol dehydrogenase family)
MSTPVVLITGALTGIGRAAAVAFAKKGAKVVVAGRRDEAGKALAKELRSFGSEAEFINADVRKEDQSALWSTRPSRGLAVSMSR